MFKIFIYFIKISRFKLNKIKTQGLIFYINIIDRFLKYFTILRFYLNINKSQYK